jgi:hypothetical protein
MADDKYEVLTVRERDGQKAWFTKIGTMMPSRNGEGFVIYLDALPLDGKLVIKRPLPSRNVGEREANKPAHDDDNIPY